MNIQENVLPEPKLRHTLMDEEVTSPQWSSLLQADSDSETGMECLRTPNKKQKTKQ